jgi:hypothetical protein
MSRLSDTLQRTLDELNISAAHLERQAALPAMSIKNIFNGSHPRADRFDKLLGSIATLSLRVDLLIAYILDDTPDTYTPSVESVLRGHLHTLLLAQEGPISTDTILQEVSPTRPLSTATKARQVLDQMRLRLDEGDTTLADWLADTGTLLAAVHLPVETATPVTEPTTQDHLRKAARQYLNENPPDTVPASQRTELSVAHPQLPPAKR